MTHLKVTYDAEANAAYVYFTDRRRRPRRWRTCTRAIPARSTG